MTVQRNEGIEWAERRGWQAERTNGNHIRLRHPKIEDATVIMSSTPSDFRSLKNMMAQCKRYERDAGIVGSDMRMRRWQRVEPFRMGRAQDGRAYYVAVCNSCGKSEQIFGYTGAIADRFDKLGWSIRSMRSADTCPACVAKRKAAPVVRVEDAKPEPASPEAPPATAIAAAMQKAIEAKKPATPASPDVVLYLSKPALAYLDEMTELGLWGRDRNETATALFLELLRRLKKETA